MNITRMYRSGRFLPVCSVRESNLVTAARLARYRCCHRHHSVRSSPSTPTHLLQPERSKFQRREDRTLESRRRKPRSSPSSRPENGRAPPLRRCMLPCALGTRLQRRLTQGRGWWVLHHQDTGRLSGDAVTVGCARYDETSLDDSGTKPVNK